MVTERDIQDLFRAMDDLRDRVAKKADAQEICRAIDSLRIRATDFEKKLTTAEPSPAAPSPPGPSAPRPRAAPRPSSE